MHTCNTQSVIFVALLCLALGASASPRIDFSVNFGWRFLRNDSCIGCAAPAFDDSTWRTLNVPHDFIHEGEFDSNAMEASGYLPYGIGWYRRVLQAPASFGPDSMLELHFEGTTCEIAVLVDLVPRVAAVYPNHYASLASQVSWQTRQYIWTAF